MADYAFCKKFAGIPGKLSADQVERRRAVVIDLIEKRIEDEGLKLTTNNINQVFTDRMFEYIISLIDEHFFENELMARFRENKCCLTACMENRCTSVGGKCWRNGNVFTIKLSTKVLKNAFEMERVNRSVNEVKCKSLLKCMLLILEHELTHAILGCDCLPSAYSNNPSFTFSNYKGSYNPDTGHSRTFMGIVNNRFGHTGYIHSIRGQDPSMVEKKLYKKEDFKKGDVIILTKKIINYSPDGDPVKIIKVPATITRLLKNSFDYVITDQEFFKKVNSKKTRHEAKGASYEIITGKLEELEYESGTPAKKEAPNTAKTNCNKRNPAPPCPAEMHEKKRPNGSTCCYKGVGVTTKTKKVNAISKNHKVKSPKKTIVKSRKCNNRNPEPPCKGGMTIKPRPNGAKCCYKQTDKA